MYFLFLFPFVYFIKTRLKSKIHKISWIFIYFIPSFILLIYFLGLGSMHNIFIAIISITLINYIYENGYIQNDSQTIKKEKLPTIRLNEASIEFINKNYSFIFLMRILIAIVLLFLFYFISNSIKLSIFILIICIILQILYFIYNNIRNIFNLFLILPMSYIRFYGFILPFVPLPYMLEFVIISIFMYPFAKFLEFTKEPKYNLERISSIVGNVDSFRLKYYFILSILSIIYFIYDGYHVYYFIIIAIYYFIFRFLAYLSISKSSFIKNMILNNSKKHFR